MRFSCVVVCPEQAIVAGDLDDPTSEITRLLDRHPTQVRKPEKGTRPKVFYLEGEAGALVPAQTATHGQTMWGRGSYVSTDGQKFEPCAGPPSNGSEAVPSQPLALPLSAPPPEQWDDWMEIELRGWPNRRVKRHYRLIPTTCFNCESACGLLTYVDKETNTIRKFEGNPQNQQRRLIGFSVTAFLRRSARGGSSQVRF